MRIGIEAGKGQGSLLLPPSKSLFHRALFCAAMAKGESKLHGRFAGEDLDATRCAIETLGARVEIKNDFVTICGADAFARRSAAFDCASSGTTLRLALPLFLLSREPVTIAMSDRLAARPMEIYRELLCKKGIFFEQSGQTIRAEGGLAAGEYSLPGDTSSQFVSGLLLALPLLEGDSAIHLTRPLESRPYVDLTKQVQKAFSVKLEETQDGFFIPGGQDYRPNEFFVEGDATIAAVYETLNALGNSIILPNAPIATLQGDARFLSLAKQLANGETVDLVDTPDLAPQLFALAAFYGAGHFTGTRRLAYKESNRALSMKEELSAFGVNLEILDNEVHIKGTLQKPSRSLDCHNDHRIAMALATLCTLTGGRLDGAECVGKSYPEFWKDLRSLGFVTVEE